MLAISLQRGGRRAQAITINNNARKAISVNIKADYINVDVVGLKGQIIYSMAVKSTFLARAVHILRSLQMR